MAGASTSSPLLLLLTLTNLNTKTNSLSASITYKVALLVLVRKHLMIHRLIAWCFYASQCHRSSPWSSGIVSWDLPTICPCKHRSSTTGLKHLILPKMPQRWRLWLWDSIYQRRLGLIGLPGTTVVIVCCMFNLRTFCFIASKEYPRPVTANSRTTDDNGTFAAPYDPDTRKSRRVAKFKKFELWMVK